MPGHRTSDDGGNEFMLIPGLGQNKPKARVLKSSFFGYVPDAFSMKTPILPSERISTPVSSSTVSPSVGERIIMVGN